MDESAPGVDTAAMAAIVRARLFEDAAPHRIGRFTVVARLGAGGMGVVYAAFDPELDRKVAIKLLFADGDDRGRLAREAQVMARLNHPNVAQVYEVGRHGDATYVAIEHVSGRTLRAWALAENPSLRERLAMLVQAGRGLAAAHAAGVIHRDFKPDNVIVGDDGRVRVLDFGLARMESDLATSGTFDVARSPASLSPDALTPRSTDSGAGTPAYMAPEQWRGGAIDARADVYAFCVTAWEILDGRRPFAGRSHADGGVLPTSTGFPRALDRALRRGLAFDREARPARMDPILHALQRDPSAARRRLVVALGGLAAIGAVLAWRHADERAREQACADEAVAIDDDWNAARADRIATAFAEVGPGDAREAFARVQTHVDAFTAAWSGARSEACLAVAPDSTSRTGGTISCLDDARVQLAVLLERLDAPMRELVPLAVSAAIALPDPATCSDPRSPRVRELGTHGLEVEDRRRLVAIAVLRQTAAYDEALAAAEALLADVAARGDTGVAAVRLVRGLALRELGRHAPAREDFEAAYYDAGATGDDFTAMRAALALVDTVGFRLADRERAQEWGRATRMYLVRLDLLDEPVAASLEGSLGGLLKDVDSAAALAAHRRAIAIVERHYGRAHPSVASSYSDLGVVLADRGDVAQGLAALRHAVEIYEETLGPDHPDLARVLNSVGAWESATGDYEGALATLHRALGITERSLGPEHEFYASVLVSIAQLDVRFGRLHEALDAYRRALAIVEQAFEPDHPRVAAVLAALAKALEDSGDVDGALQHYRRAIAIQERASGSDDAKLAPFLGNLGILLVNTDATDEGLAILRRTERIIATHYGEDNDDRAVVLSAIASTETSRGHPEAALVPLEEALVIMQKANTAADRRADIEFELGRALYLSGGDRERALALAKRARESWLPIGPPRAEWVGYADELIAELEAKRRRGAASTAP